MATEMVTVRVARRTVSAKLAEGYVPLKGSGPDGLRWEDGDLLMQIPKQKYDKLQKERSAASDLLREAIRTGKLATQPPPDVEAKSTVETPGVAE